MSSTATQTSPQQTQDEPTEQPSRAQKREAREQARQHRIDVAAQKLMNKLRSEDRKLPPGQRKSEAQLWQAARAQATKDEQAQRSQIGREPGREKG